jgi:hypothetical protein
VVERGSGWDDDSVGIDQSLPLGIVEGMKEAVLQMNGYLILDIFSSLSRLVVCPGFEWCTMMH